MVFVKQITVPRKYFSGFNRFLQNHDLHLIFCLT